MAKKEICDQVGIKLQSIDFNEAQKGKNQCDRDGAVAKRKIRTYVNEGHDVTDAVSVIEAIDAPLAIPKNSKSCVIELDYNNMELGKAKIKDISRCHYFEFEENGIRAWEFQGIGNEKLLQQQDVNFISCSKVVENLISVQCNKLTRTETQKRNFGVQTVTVQQFSSLKKPCQIIF